MIFWSALTLLIYHILLHFIKIIHTTFQEINELNDYVRQNFKSVWWRICFNLHFHKSEYCFLWSKVNHTSSHGYYKLLKKFVNQMAEV